MQSERAGVAVPRSAVSLRIITACGAEREREKTCKDQPSCSHPIMHELAGSVCCSGHKTFPVCVFWGCIWACLQLRVESH